MNRGSFIGMDRFGLDFFLPTEKRVETVAKLCQMGHAGQMVLAHDTNCFMDTIPAQVKETRMPNWHFLHISKDILPALRQRGVTEDQIRAMLVDNPRKVFERQGAY
jgi:phosphotriesterase-related protein